MFPSRQAFAFAICILPLIFPSLRQSLGFLLTAAGYILGHSHRGRAFFAGAHGSFASILLVPIFLQLSLGVYLKLHIHEQSIRPWAVRLHGVVGKAWPLLGWIQMLFGAIAFRGYCRGDHLGQCLAHYIMASSLSSFGPVVTIVQILNIFRPDHRVVDSLPTQS